MSVKSSSASFISRKISKNSVMSVLTHVSSVQLLRGSSSTLPPLGRLSKATINQKSYSTTHARAKVIKKEKNPDCFTSCYCLDCATPGLVPEAHLQFLKNHLSNLQRELCQEKNKNQILRRQVWMAEKSVKQVIGSSFEDLAHKADGESWKGRQETICVLRRQIRKLTKKAENLEKSSILASARKRFASRSELSEVSVIPDERQDYWCLELERQSILRTAKQEKRIYIESRDILKDKVELWSRKTKEMENEQQYLRDSISASPKKAKEGTTDRLGPLETQIKVELDGKVELRQKLEDLNKQICRNSKAITAARKRIMEENQIWKEKKAILDSLKSKESSLLEKVEEVMKEENINVEMGTEKNLNDLEQDYNKILCRVDKAVLSLSDSKYAVDRFKESHKDCSYSKFWNMNSNVTNKITADDSSQANNIKMPQVKSLSKIGYPSKCSKEFLRKNSLNAVYKFKLQKHRINFETVESENLGRLSEAHSICVKVSEEVFSYLKHSCVLWKLTYDINVLKSRLKKLRKAKLNASKPKLVKRKSSSQQIVEKDGRKQYLCILKIENKFTKVLIKRVFNSRHDDLDLFQSLLCKNKDFFLKSIYKHEFEK